MTPTPPPPTLSYTHTCNRYNNMVQDWADVADILLAIGLEQPLPTALGADAFAIDTTTTATTPTASPSVADGAAGASTRNLLAQVAPPSPAHGDTTNTASARASRHTTTDSNATTPRVAAVNAAAAAVTPTQIVASLSVPGASAFGDVSATSVAPVVHPNAGARRDANAPLVPKVREMVVSRLAMPTPERRSDGFAAVIQSHRACPVPTTRSRRRSGATKRGKKRGKGKGGGRSNSGGSAGDFPALPSSSHIAGGGSASASASAASPSASDAGDPDGAPRVTSVTLGFETVTESERVTAFAVEKLNALATSVASASRLIHVAAATSRQGHDVFLMLQHRVTQYVWRMFRNKVLCIEEPITNERETRGLLEYTKLHPQKYKDLLDKFTTKQTDAEEQLKAMEALLVQHRGVLAKIFQYYWCVVGAVQWSLV